VERAQLALALQHFGRQNRAGKRQGDGQQQGFVEGYIQPQQYARQKHQAGKDKVQNAAADHFRPHQVAHLELEAHGKQQQQNPEVSDMVEDDTVLRTHPHPVAKGRQGKPCPQVADQRRQPDQAHAETEPKGKNDPYRFYHAAPLKLLAAVSRLAAGKDWRHSAGYSKAYGARRTVAYCFPAHIRSKNRPP